MRILYVFPHPDDESFGPARAMAAFGKDIHFEIFREDHKPPLRDLFEGLQDRHPSHVD